jgi:folate-binding protein YgfZ
MSTTLLAKQFGEKAVAGEYAGGETVLRFGSPAEELRQLRHGCAAFDLGWRGKLIISGEDRVRWLNGMVSNNTRDLPQDFGNFNFVLNAQGRIQADLVAFQRGDFYMVESDAGQIPAIREFFDRYIIMDDVEIEEIGGRLASIGVAGPRAAELLREAGMVSGDLPSAWKPGQLADGTWQGHGFTLVRDPIAVRDWWEIWLAPENVAPFWNQLLSAGAAPAGAEALEWQRILLGVPRFGVDTGGRELAQETGQDYALHSSKGCYIGQEIIERVRARGQVHRGFSGLLLEGGAAARGSKVTSDNAEVGEITSSAVIPVEGAGRSVALAYLKRAHATPEAKLQVEGRAAKLASLPFQF